ncbi:MAG TPA: hypothetical protein VF916_05960 [Ktedonobacterales bacterium]
MQSFRRLPPFLRAVSVLGQLSLLAAVGVMTWTHLATRGEDQSAARREWNQGTAIGWSLLVLGLACLPLLLAYNARFARRPTRRAPLTDAWQTQLKVALALAALPFCTLVGALLIPSRSSLFQVVYALGVLSLLVLLVGWIRVADRAHG